MESPVVLTALAQEIGFDIVGGPGLLLIAVSFVVLAAIVLIAFEILKRVSRKRRD